MPKGVEHSRSGPPTSIGITLPLSLMPKGVEHKERIDEIRYQFFCHYP